MLQNELNAETVLSVVTAYLLGVVARDYFVTMVCLCVSLSIVVGVVTLNSDVL